MNHTKTALLIFVKNPQWGQVKTRLAKDIGNDNALKVYLHLLNYTNLICQDLALDKIVFYSHFIPDQDAIFNKNLYQYQLQHMDTDLGKRMYEAFAWAFAQGYERALIIGSDCRDLTSDILQEAATQLANHDFVLGRAVDGGYYLLGMGYAEPALFVQKTWSTSSVAADTLRDIERLGKSCYLLPTLNDVDEQTDLGAWYASL